MTSAIVGPSIHSSVFTEDDSAVSTAGASAAGTNRLTTLAMALVLLASAGPTTNTGGAVVGELREWGDSSTNGTAFVALTLSSGSDSGPNLAQSVRDLREMSGLTWDQLSRLFGVSRRAVHNWANGGRMTARHADVLSRLVHLVDSLPASDPSSRRDLLLAPARGGKSLFDAFRILDHKHEAAINRSPLSPDELLGAYGEGD